MALVTVSLGPYSYTQRDNTGAAVTITRNALVRVSNDVSTDLGLPAITEADLVGASGTGPNGPFNYRLRGKKSGGKRVKLVSDQLTTNGNNVTYQIMVPTRYPYHLLQDWLNANVNLVAGNITRFVTEAGSSYPLAIAAGP